jgi:hypothetical protein
MNKNFTSLDYIITSRHYAILMGCESSFERIMKMREDIHQKKHIILPIQENKFSIEPVQGFIENSQWIGRCECGGCEFVDTDEPVFYCFCCCNRAQNHMLRRVIFPDFATRKEIERLLLLRPVDDMRGQTDLERAGLARALIVVQIDKNTVMPLTRSWNAGETLEDLHKQQDKAIAAWNKSIADGTAFVDVFKREDGE